MRTQACDPCGDSTTTTKGPTGPTGPCCTGPTGPTGGGSASEPSVTLFSGIVNASVSPSYLANAGNDVTATPFANPIGYPVDIGTTRTLSRLSVRQETEVPAGASVQYRVVYSTNGGTTWTNTDLTIIFAAGEGGTGAQPKTIHAPPFTLGGGALFALRATVVGTADTLAATASLR